jgi:hypothetical protein
MSKDEEYVASVLEVLSSNAYLRPDAAFQLASAGLVAAANADLEEQLFLRLRYFLATALSELGDEVGARKGFQGVVERQIQLLGPQHREVLQSQVRSLYLESDWRDEAEFLNEAQHLQATLLTLLNDSDPLLLDLQLLIFDTQALIGDEVDPVLLFGASQTYEKTLEVFGPDHYKSLVARFLLTTAEVVSALNLGLGTEAAIRRQVELLNDLVRVMGDSDDTALLCEALLIICAVEGWDDRPIIRLRTLVERHDAKGLGPQPTGNMLREFLVEKLIEEGEFSTAEVELEDLLARQVKVFGELGKNTRNALSSLAELSHSQSDFESAYRWRLRLLRGQREALGKDHPETLSTQVSVALAQSEVGDLIGSIFSLEEVIPELSRVLGEHHPETFDARAGLAITYETAGEIDKSRALLCQILVEEEEFLGIDDPLTLFTRLHLARKQLDDDGAFESSELLENLVSDQIRVLGHDHPETLEGRLMLAAQRVEVGDEVKSVQLHEDLFHDLVRVLGNEDDLTIGCMVTLSTLKSAAGDLDDALHYGKLLAETYEQLLGPDHEYTIGTNEFVQSIESERKLAAVEAQRHPEVSDRPNKTSVIHGNSPSDGQQVSGYSTRTWPASEAETETVEDLGRRAQKLTGRIEFLSWTLEPVISGRELLLRAYESDDVGKSVELLSIAMKMLRRTSSLQIDDEALRMLEIEGASFWRGVIGGLLNDASTSFYFEMNFADITALFHGGAIDQTTALRKMGRCNEERAEWLRFRGDPEASEKFRLAIKAYEGASLPDRARDAAAAQKSRAPAGPSSFLERKGPPSGGAILGSSSAYEFRNRLANGS